MRRPWLICALLSIGAHALAVTLLPPADRVQHKPPRPSSTTLTWQTRLASSTTSASSAPSSSDDTAPPLTEPPLASAAPGGGRLSPPGEVPPDLPSTQELDVPSAAPVAAPQLGPNTDGDGEYIPRPQLSVAPIPVAPILLSAPPGIYPPDRITGILSLYIDETGKVHHLISSTPPLPAEFEEIAKRAFLSADFHPGQLNGQAVKSRVRVEVVFDNTPLPAVIPAVPPAASAVH